MLGSLDNGCSVIVLFSKYLVKIKIFNSQIDFRQNISKCLFVLGRNRRSIETISMRECTCAANVIILFSRGKIFRGRFGR